MPENIAITATNAGFAETTLPLPTPAPGEIVVALEATALNPIDNKLRANATTPRIFGYDAVGNVVASASSDFAVGARVLYAGTTKKPGSYQHYQAVPAVLAAAAPVAAPAEDLAALPLVGLTAWELLFEKMGFTPQADANRGLRLLVINGAGGVGSMLCQLAHWAGLEVLATASPKHFDWLRAHGVSTALDYHDDWQNAIEGFVDGVAILYAPESYLAAASKLIAPLGHIATIVTPTKPLDLAALKPKAASFDQEYMFTKSDFGVRLDSTRQILDALVELYTAGILDASVTQTAPFDRVHLQEATAALAAGHSVGKSVLLMKA